MVSPPPEGRKGRPVVAPESMLPVCIGMYQDVAIYVYIYIYMLYMIVYVLYMYQYVSGFSWIDVFLFFFPRFLCEKQTQFAWPWNDRLHRNSVPHPCQGDTGCWQCGPGGRPIPDALCCGPFINFHLCLWGKQRSKMIDLFNQSLPSSNDHSWGSVFGHVWSMLVMCRFRPLCPKLTWTMAPWNIFDINMFTTPTMVPSWPISQNAWKFRSSNVFSTSMCFFPLNGHPNFSWYKILSGWWYTYPSENMSSSVGILIPNWMETHKIHVPNHQPAIKIWDFKGSFCFFADLWWVFYRMINQCLKPMKSIYPLANCHITMDRSTIL